MAPWVFNVMFPYDTQFTFGSLTFVTGEDGNLKVLPPGSAPECLALVYGQASCPPTISSTSGGAYSGLDPYTGAYIHNVRLVRGIPIVTSTLQPLAEASILSSLAASPDQDLADDYSRLGEVPVGTPPRRVALSSW
jgi:hypothetical protein